MDAKRSGGTKISLPNRFRAGVGMDTYEFLELVPVLDLDDRLALTADNLERPEYHVSVKLFLPSQDSRGAPRLTLTSA